MDQMEEASFVPYFRIYKRSKYEQHDPTILPNIEGVISLTKPEIRKDIRDIERSLIQEDTDSESSVRSEDILPSSYPVKPRKMVRHSQRSDSNRAHAGGDKTANLNMIEECLDFLRAIRVSKKTVHDAEVEREKLEAQIASYKSATKTLAEELATLKKGQENYIQLLQGMVSQELYLRSSLSRQGSMLADVHHALQARRLGIDTLESSIQNTRTLFHPKSKGNSKNSNSKLGNIHPNETMVLTVYLKKADKEVTFFKGLEIHTPMGPAKIESIMPQESKMVLRLSFGIMYARIEKVVTWGVVCSTSSDEALQHNWKSFRNSLEISLPIRKSIAEILRHENSNREDGMLTDDENSSGEEEHFVSASQGSVSTVPGGPSSSSSSSSSGVSEVVASSSSTSTSSASIATSSNSAQSSATTPNNPVATVFPIDTPMHHSRRNLLGKRVRNNLLSFTNPEDLALIFCHPNVVGEMVDAMDKKDFHSIRIFEDALKGPDGLMISYLAQHTWGGDYPTMKESVANQTLEISQLQEELLALIKEEKSLSASCQRLIGLTSSLRLSMFTRRVRYRQHLCSLPLKSQSSTSSTSASSSAFSSLDLNNENGKKESAVLANMGGMGGMVGMSGTPNSNTSRTESTYDSNSMPTNEISSRKRTRETSSASTEMATNGNSIPSTAKDSSSSRHSNKRGETENSSWSQESVGSGQVVAPPTTSGRRRAVPLENLPSSDAEDAQNTGSTDTATKKRNPKKPRRF